MEWYQDQTNWAEPHSYDDPAVTSPRLAEWFRDIVRSYPPMNGPFSSGAVDDPHVTDYSIGSVVIYAAFAWSVAEAAYGEVRRLAKLHRVGLFDASGDGGIEFPSN